MKFRRGKFLSVLVVVLLSVGLLTFRSISLPTKALTWDVFGYYLYLPATFIYDDPGLTDAVWLDNIMDEYQPSATLYQLVNGTDGKRVIKYTSGLALLWAPFFFIAHWLAQWLGYPADGFSLPYQLVLSYAGILWAIAGLLLLRKILIRYFDEKVTSVTLLLIGIGTNYFQLTAFDGTLLSHNFLFTLYALLVYSTIRWYERPGYGHSFLIGLSCGLITLIRPSEAICVLIPLLWNTTSWRQFTFRFKILKFSFIHVAAFILPALTVGAIQLIYWKTTSGNWLFYSYDNPGEGFRFFPPYILEFLFSFRKGWFVYTPVMIFAFIGFYHLYKWGKSWNLAIITFILLDIWIISAWSCWWYAGGSFSSRAILPAYVLLSLPLAAFTERVMAGRLKWIAAGIAFLLISLNLFQTWQFENGIIDKERMTFPYYQAVFGKVNADREKLDHLLLVERSTEMRETPGNLDRYKKRTLLSTPSQTGNDTSQAIKLWGDNSFYSGPDLPFHALTQEDHAWIHVKTDYFIPDGFAGENPMLVASFHYKGKAYKYRAEALSADTAIRGRWNSVEFWYLTPEVRTPDDNLKVYVWNRVPSEIFLRNFNVTIYERRK